MAEITVGLALGSGSSRGWAHIGIIEALKEAGIKISAIAGCSIGAYVGALYACGCLESLKDFVLQMDGKKIFSYFDIIFPRSGLLNGSRRLRELYYMHTDVEYFSELEIPLMIVATDLESGEKVVLKSGRILDALRASMSIPGLFAPALVKGHCLVDGGLVDPVPVGVARAMGVDAVIAVDLNSNFAAIRRTRAKKTNSSANEAGHKSDRLKKLTDFYATAGAAFRSRLNELLHKDNQIPDIIETVTTSINIMQERITRINLAVEPPDILIQPRLGDLKILDFDQVEMTIEEGYLAAKQKIDEVFACIQRLEARGGRDDAFSSG